MNRAGDLLASRYTRQPSPKLTSKNNISIEGSVSNNITSIELPAEIAALIDNKAYRPRYLKLWRLYPQQLMAWARVAREKKNLTEPPSHYFAKGCKVGIWEERTLKFLAELFAVRELAERVAAKLKTAVTRFIYQQVWRGVNVERWADMAAEAGEHKGKYFTWLCRREAATPAPSE